MNEQEILQRQDRLQESELAKVRLNDETELDDLLCQHFFESEVDLDPDVFTANVMQKLDARVNLQRQFWAVFVLLSVALMAGMLANSPLVHGVWQEWLLGKWSVMSTIVILCTLISAVWLSWILIEQADNTM